MNKQDDKAINNDFIINHEVIKSFNKFNKEHPNLRLDRRNIEYGRMLIKDITLDLMMMLAPSTKNQEINLLREQNNTLKDQIKELTEQSNPEFLKQLERKFNALRTVKEQEVELIKFNYKNKIKENKSNTIEEFKKDKELIKKLAEADIALGKRWDWIDKNKKDINKAIELIRLKNKRDYLKKIQNKEMWYRVFNELGFENLANQVMTGRK